MFVEVTYLWGRSQLFIQAEITMLFAEDLQELMMAGALASTSLPLGSDSTAAAAAGGGPAGGSGLLTDADIMERTAAVTEMSKVST